MNFVLLLLIKRSRQVTSCEDHENKWSFVVSIETSTRWICFKASKWTNGKRFYSAYLNSRRVRKKYMHVSESNSLVCSALTRMTATMPVEIPESLHNQSTANSVINQVEMRDEIDSRFRFWNERVDRLLWQQHKRVVDPLSESQRPHKQS